MTTPPTPKLTWRRLLAEGFVIVASILLAFAIDAWWDGRTERRLIEQQRAQLGAQMQANSATMATVAAFSNDAVAAATKLVQLVGPVPQLVSRDSLSVLVRRSFRSAPVVLETLALTALLASGEFGVSSDAELQRLLMEFRAEADRFAVNQAIYRERRERFVVYFEAGVASGAFATEATGRHDPTDFEVPVSRLLTDSRLEALAGNLLVAAGLVGENAASARALADSIVALTGRAR